jgi:putative spermidine/putrescine transport system ATP-binding protein
MQMELREIQRKLELTTIFVTHDQSEALSLSDRIAVMSEGHVRQVDSPDAVYSNPRERFVASFIGDANVLRGQLVGIDKTHATVTIGSVQVTVPSTSLQGVPISAPVDLFIRPEQLRFARAGEPSVTDGTIISRVYHGGHVDFHVECVDSTRRRLIVRLSEPHAITAWPTGSRVGISIHTNEVIAFAVS